MRHPMNSSAVTIKLGGDDIEIPSVSTVVSSIDGIGAKIGQLQEACVCGWSEQRNLCKSMDSSPSCCSTPKSPPKNLKSLAVRGFCDDDQAPLFLPVYVKGLIVSPQKQIETVG